MSASGSDGVPRSEFATGEEIHLEIEIEAHRNLAGARLTAQLSTMEHALGAFGTPFSGFNFDLAPPRTTLRLVLESIPLLVGTYSINLALNGPGPAELLDYQAEAVTFRIGAPPTDPLGFARDGLVAFQHRWERSGVT